MNGSRDSIAALLDGILSGVDEVSAADVAVCAPFVYLSQVAERLQGSVVTWGAQDVSSHANGAFTGEISADMLLEFGCRYAIVGHSERRQYHGETDTVVADKFAAAQVAGLIPILCLGEQLEERESGVTEQVVARQLDAVLDRVGAEALAQGVIAYEPVWAIGTGKTASPEQAQEVHAFIRARVAAKAAAAGEAVRILYGGSMNAGNAAQLLAMADIDGGLIGGASLKADDFLTIARSAAA